VSGAVLWLVAALFSGILAGAVVTITLAVIPALHEFSPEDDFRVHRVFNPLPDYYLPHSLFISLIAGTAALATSDGRSGAGRAAAIAAVVISVAIILISHRGTRPINLVIRRWSGEGLPRGYEHMRRRWDMAHRARTVFCVGLVCCYAVAGGCAAAGKSADPVQVANLVLAALMAGGILIVQVAVVPSIHRLPTADGVRLHVRVDRYIEYSLPAFTVLTAATGAAVLARNDGLTGADQRLVMIGIAATLVVAVISHYRNRRLNLRLRSWRSELPPTAYRALRRSWDRWHVVRTATGLAALVCFAVALVGG
jgi:hypothetical protein